MDVYTMNANDLSTYIKDKQKLNNARNPTIIKDNNLSIGIEIFYKTNTILYFRNKI